jgi:hypothetical protein
MSTTTYQSITEALSEIKANQLNEDGHTDVPSSIRMCKTIMEDAHDILCALCNTDMDEEIDTWWTNKLAVSASTLNKLRDYYVHEVDHEEQPDEADMEIEEQRGLPQPVRGKNPSGAQFPKPPGPGGTPRGSAVGAINRMPSSLKPDVKRVGLSSKDLDNPIPPGSNPTKGFLKTLNKSAKNLFGLGTPEGALILGGLSATVGEGIRRRSGMQKEAIEENIDMEAITNEYGKYAIPAGAAALGFTLAGEKRKRPTFKGFLKNAIVAGAAGLGAEALKRQYIANNPDVTSPFLQKATVPEFKPTGQG